MKKLFAPILALALALSMGTVAFADTVSTEGWTAPAREQAITLTKVYDVKGSKDSALYPSETLEFIVTAGQNPDIDMITVDDLVVAGNSGQTIKINLPQYDTVGKYTYTIAEVEGSSKGVEYTTAQLAINVLVSYDYANGCLKSEVALGTSDDSNGKVDTFTNEYNVGHMTVKKTVSGNLASTDQYFKMTVTFNADETVNSDIAVSGGSNSANPTTIEEGWTGKKVVTFYLRADETLTFDNIPAGVTYTVAEDTQHGNVDGVFDADDVTTDYTVTYTNENGDIAVSETDNVVVNNAKSATIDTAVILDNAPFVVVIAVVAAAAVAFVASRRRNAQF